MGREASGGGVEKAWDRFMFSRGIKLRIMFQQIYFHCFYALLPLFLSHSFITLYTSDCMEKGQTLGFLFSPQKNIYFCFAFIDPSLAEVSYFCDKKN